MEDDFVQGFLLLKSLAVRNFYRRLLFRSKKEKVKFH